MTWDVSPQFWTLRVLFVGAAPFVGPLSRSRSTAADIDKDHGLAHR
jgi:hypothetical protein